MLLIDHPELAAVHRRDDYPKAGYDCCHGRLLSDVRLRSGPKTFVCGCVDRPDDRLLVARVARREGLLTEPARKAI